MSMDCRSFWFTIQPCCCRSGLVISIAEPDTLFVIKKMAKRLQVPISKAAVSEGVLALDEQEDTAATKQVAGL